jgi:YbgC/YbaW family acyl-CoA thioester hydrolase
MKIIRHPVRIYWGDTDPATIVFYPNYFSWFDQAALALFESVNLSWEILQERYGVPGLPIVEANARFIAPCRFNDRIEVESCITEWHDKTFRISHTIWNGAVKSVEGYEVRVWSKPRAEDPKRLKAWSIPPEIRAAFD